MKNDMGADSPLHRLPAGTVTFLFSDIEGSTELLKRLRDQYATLLANHRRILRGVFEKWSGREVDTQGDAFFYSFSRATEAVAAAVEAQQALAAHTWPGDVEVRVRMGLHTGEPLLGDEGYVGMDVHRAARVAHAGHGGQVLLSQTTTPLVQDQLPEGVEMVDLGRHRLKDMKQPERISQLAIDGLQTEFPPLESLEALPAEVPHEFGPVKPPSFLAGRDAGSESRLVFVDRDRELASLSEYLERAFAGEGMVVFIAGGAGRGKTALLREFSRRAMEEHEDLLSAFGSSSAFAGEGDPYLPFRELMEMLAGDVEERWRAGTVSRRNAARLWEGMPLVAQQLTEQGSGLVDVFVSGAPLLARLRSAMRAGAGWVERLGMLAGKSHVGQGDLDQRSLFEQYAGVLANVAREHPLLLILDDMQWADSASIDLLFHIGRRLRGQRILILGAYRPEGIARGGEEDPHPLAAVLSEFKRLYGEMLIDISRTSEVEDREFVAAYLDREPNDLPPAFREGLYEHTRGHALFTVEMLRTLRERGDLIQDPERGWVVVSDPIWDILPAKVEGVIEERVNRLDPALKNLLRIASVEGTQFTAQVLAVVGEAAGTELGRQLSVELDQKYRLIQEDGSLEVAGRRLHRYRFRHELFQAHVYGGLGGFERAELHRKIGQALEGLYGEAAPYYAAQLARHFLEGDSPEKAVQYLLISGDRARLVYANREAAHYYTQALEHMRQTVHRDEMVQTLLKLGLVHTAAFDSKAAEEAYARAFALSDHIPRSKESPQFQRGGATLRMAIEEPANWDPGLIGDDVSSFIAGQLFQGLVEVLPDYNVVPAAASKWEVGEGGRMYTFHLRPDLQWSDGSPLRASDFRYAWIHNLGRDQESPAANLLNVIRTPADSSAGEGAAEGDLDIRCPDDHTVQVWLKRPSAYFPQLMAHPVAFPASEGRLGAEDHVGLDPRNMRCSGAYVVADWSEEGHMTLTKNPYYTGPLPGNVDRVECTFIRGYEAALDAYARGELDAVSLINAGSRAVAQARARFPKELSFVPYPSTFFLAFLASESPFDDLHLRKALIRAVDRDAWVQAASRGQYQPAFGGFVPPGMPGHSPGIGLTFDPALAARELRAARYGKDLSRISLLTTGGKPDDPNVSFLRQAWQEHLGIEVVHESVSWGEYLRRRDHDPAPLSLGGWSADYLDPDSMLRAVFHSAEGYYHPMWRDARFDALVDQASRAMDQGERIRLYQKADRILVSGQAAVMPLGYVQSRRLAKPWVRMPKVALQFIHLKDVSVLRPDGDGLA